MGGWFSTPSVEEEWPGWQRWEGASDDVWRWHDGEWHILQEEACCNACYWEPMGRWWWWQVECFSTIAWYRWVGPHA